VFSIQGRHQKLRLESIDNLELLEESGAREQIQQYPIEGQCRQPAFTQLSHADLWDEPGAWVRMWIPFEEAVNVLDSAAPRKIAAPSSTCETFH